MYPAIEWLGHTSNQQIAAIEVEGEIVEREFFHREEMLANHVGEPFAADGPEVLLEVEGVHIEHVNLANGEKPRSFMHRCAEETACRYHMVCRRLLAEILERRDGLGATLDFVEEDKRAFWCNTRLETFCEHAYQTLGFQVSCEELDQIRAFGEVGVYDILELALGEGESRIGFPYLSGSEKDKRLATR